MRGAHSSLKLIQALLTCGLFMIVLCPAAAKAQGFGGAQEASDECVIVVDGKRIPCVEKTSAKTSRSPKKNTSTSASSERLPSKQGEAKLDISEDDKIRTSNEHIRPFGKRVGPEPEKLIDVLGEFEKQLKAREKEHQSLAERPIYKRQERERLDGLRDQIKREKEVVAFLTARARAQVVACSRNTDPAWYKRYGKPKGYIMTPGGALARAPEIAPDPQGCERQRFTSAALLEDSLRYFTLKYFLANKRWDYGQKSEREQYEKELSLLDEKLNFSGKPRVLKYDKAAAEKLYKQADPKSVYLKNQKD